MKKLVALLILAGSLCAISAHAQAVNNRVMIWVPPAASFGPIAQFNAYCGIGKDPATWSTAQSTVPVAQAVPPATQMNLALADTITHCAMKVRKDLSGPEGVWSNVVDVTVPGALIIKITKSTVEIDLFDAVTLELLSTSTTMTKVAEFISK